MTDKDAKLLVEMAKCLRKAVIRLPEKGSKEYYKADNLTKTKKFTIQAYIGRGNTLKCQISLLYRKTQMLMRIDTGAAGAHYNDDGSVIPPYTPHIHFFDETCLGENKCHNATRLPDSFRDPQDCIALMQDFLKSINIVDSIKVQIFQQGGLNDAYQ